MVPMTEHHGSLSHRNLPQQGRQAEQSGTIAGCKCHPGDRTPRHRTQHAVTERVSHPAIDQERRPKHHRLTAGPGNSKFASQTQQDLPNRLTDVQNDLTLPIPHALRRLDGQAVGNAVPDGVRLGGGGYVMGFGLWGHRQQWTMTTMRRLRTCPHSERWIRYCQSAWRTPHEDVS